MAYVIQHDRLLPNLTVEETLSFVAKLAYPKHNGKELVLKVRRGVILIIMNTSQLKDLNSLGTPLYPL